MGRRLTWSPSLAHLGAVSKALILEWGLKYQEWVAKGRGRVEFWLSQEHKPAPGTGDGDKLKWPRIPSQFPGQRLQRELSFSQSLLVQDKLNLL